MNDKYELIQGIQITNEIFKSIFKFKKSFILHNKIDLFNEYNLFNKQNNNIYIFCLSEIKRNDNNGILSMWRGYGNNGNGAALILKPNYLHNALARFNSDFYFHKIKYCNNKSFERNLISIVEEFCALTRRYEKLIVTNVEFSKLICQILFKKLTIESLTLKHIGFKEEKEWRLLFFKPNNINNIKLYNCYLNENIELKLKLNINSYLEILSTDASAISINDLFCKIILGPTALDDTHSLRSKLTIESLKDFLNDKGLTKMAKNIVQSSIPYRPR